MLLRNIFIFIIQFLFTSLFAQKQSFIIDLSNKNVIEVVMGNGSKVFPGSRIYLYNIWNKQKTRLITVSILPDITNGETEWDTLSTLPQSNQFVNIEKVAAKALSEYFDHQENNPEDYLSLKSMDYTPLILKNGRIITTKNDCLVEIYKSPASISSVPLFKEFSYVTLNTAVTHSDENKLQDFVKLMYKQVGFIIDITGKIFCKNKISIASHQGYLFWVSSPPFLHVNWQYYGIEKFVFIPQIGIISGSFVRYLHGDTGNVVSLKSSGFEKTLKMFRAISINGKTVNDYFSSLQK